MIDAVILDRDGVINEDSDNYIKSPDEWHAIPGSLQAIKKLNNLNIKVFIATNQSGVGRGYYSLDTLNDIHNKMLGALKKINAHINEIIFCPHHPDDDCLCRKPKPGMLHQLINKHQLCLSNTLMVGDAWRDIQAAFAANIGAVLVKTGKGYKTVNEHKHHLLDVGVYNDLSDFVNKIKLN